MLIDWTAEPKQELIEMGIDLIIGTDVIYKGSYPLKLADFLAKMGCKGNVLYIYIYILPLRNI